MFEKLPYGLLWKKKLVYVKPKSCLGVKTETGEHGIFLGPAKNSSEETRWAAGFLISFQPIHIPIAGIVFSKSPPRSTIFFSITQNFITGVLIVLIVIKSKGKTSPIYTLIIVGIYEEFLRLH